MVVVVVVVVGGLVGGEGGKNPLLGFRGGDGRLGAPAPKIDPKRGRTDPTKPAPPPPPWGGRFCGGPPPPPAPPRTAPRTGKSAAAVVPASEFPVAALRMAGAALNRSEDKSPPPPPEGLCGAGLGGGVRGGRGVVGRGGVFCFSLISLFEVPLERDSQQTVPLLQESDWRRMLEGLAHNCFMD